MNDDQTDAIARNLSVEYERQRSRVQKIREAYGEFPAGAYGEQETRRLLAEAKRLRSSGDYHQVHEAIALLSEWHPGREL